MSRIYRAIRLALAFLTTLQVPIRDDEVTPSRLAEARFAYPVVGALIGLVLAALSEALRALDAPAGPSAFLIVAATAAASGGLHLDGLADTADGLFLPGDRARRLAAMRDPHVGSFGVSAMILVLIGKFAALEALAGADRSAAILGASAVGRSLILVAAGLAPYARPEGTGRFLVDATPPRDSVLGAAIGSAVGLAVAGGPGLIASSMALAVALILTRTACRKLGGITGDTLGALVELGELAFLLTLGLFPAG